MSPRETAARLYDSILARENASPDLGEREIAIETIGAVIEHYDRRTAELLAATNAELDRRREAEAEAAVLRIQVELMAAALYEREEAGKALLREIKRLRGGAPDPHVHQSPEASA